jgi:hypothetical protein
LAAYLVGNQSVAPTCVLHVIGMARESLSQIARLSAYPRPMLDPDDRGPVFDGIRIGRPATGALLDAGYRALANLPADLEGRSAVPAGPGGLS